MKSRHTLLGAALFVLAARPADAHAILVESTPSINAALPAGHVAMRLRYNSRIDAERSRLTLVGRDGAAVVLPIAPGTPPDLLESSAELPAGTWRLRWQVLAIDGHITRGDVPFTLTRAAATAP